MITWEENALPDNAKGGFTTGVINMTQNDRHYKSLIVNVIYYNSDFSVQNVSHASEGWEMDVFRAIGGHLSL